MSDAERKAKAVARTKRWKEKNREKRRAWDKAWRLANPEKTKAARAKYRAAHPEVMKASTKRWQDANKERRLIARLAWKFGLTYAAYQSMLASQRNLCAICGGSAANGRRLSVDHDHSTGAVRALLCAGCNAGLGLFRDNPRVLLKAAAYLNTHRQQRLKGV